VARQGQPSALPSTLYDKDYFLTACEGHEEFLKSQGELLSRRLSEAFAVASVEPGMRVLDVGCGRGEILRHCARLGADAYGIDYAEVAVDLSQDLIQSAGGSPAGGSPGQPTTKMGFFGNGCDEPLPCPLSDAERRVPPFPGREGGQGVRSNGAVGPTLTGNPRKPKMAVYQADAKRLPFPSAAFDRVLMFDVVEHLHPWELDAAMAEVRRVLRPGGMYVVHTAPNRWYDAYAYPIVRLIRTWQGKGKLYPQDPRALNVAVNQDVHVNEQDMVSLRRNLARAGFGKIKVWLATPPQHRREPLLFKAARHVAFHWPPFRWFFEREVFGVGVKV